MQLEDLQQQWQTLNAKLDRSIKLESELLRLAVVQPVRKRMQRWVIWPSMDILFSLCVVHWCVWFLVRHWNEWTLMLAAIGMLLSGVALLVNNILQLEQLTRIDWSAPVAEIQKSLAKVRMAKMLQFKWIILLSPLVFFCLLIVGLQELLDRLGSDQSIVDKLYSPWVLGNVLFGIVFAMLGFWIVRFMAWRFQNTAWWQSCLDSLTDASLKKANAELKRWSEL